MRWVLKIRYQVTLLHFTYLCNLPLEKNILVTQRYGLVNLLLNWPNHTFVSTSPHRWWLPHQVGHIMLVSSQHVVYKKAEEQTQTKAGSVPNGVLGALSTLIHKHLRIRILADQFVKNVCSSDRASKKNRSVKIDYESYSFYLYWSTLLSRCIESVE